MITLVLIFLKTGSKINISLISRIPVAVILNTAELGYNTNKWLTRHAKMGKSK